MPSPDAIDTENRSTLFQLWGAVEAKQNGRIFSVGSRKEQCTLVALITANGHEIQRSTLWNWIWYNPPSKAELAIDRTMTELRKNLRNLELDHALTSRDKLCRFNIPQNTVDAFCAKEWTTKARTLGDDDASTLLHKALTYCQGEPLAGLDSPRINSYRTQMLADRLATEIAFYQVRIRLGHHLEHLGELGQLFKTHPHNTLVTALTMCALDLAGRRPEAFDVYAQHCQHMGDHSGIDPASELSDLRQRILTEQADREHSFPLVRSSAAKENSTMHTQNELVVAVRPEDGNVEDIREAVVRSFGEVDWQAREDYLLGNVSSRVKTPYLVDTWIENFRQAVEGYPARTHLAITFGQEQEAHTLVRSDFARRMLNGAPNSHLVVIVSDDVYQCTLVQQDTNFPETSYLKADDGSDGWACVPGHSVAPIPREGKHHESEEVPGGAARGWTITNTQNKIGKQVMATVINNSRW